MHSYKKNVGFNAGFHLLQPDQTNLRPFRPFPFSFGCGVFPTCDGPSPVAMVPDTGTRQGQVSELFIYTKGACRAESGPQSPPMRVTNQ